MDRLGSTPLALDARSRAVLQHYERELLESIAPDPNLIADVFSGKNLLNDDQRAALHLQSTTGLDKARKLLIWVKEGSQSMFEALLDALHSTDNDHLVTKLKQYHVDEDDKWSDDLLREMLIKGGVPHFHTKTTPRTWKLQSIRDLLTLLSQDKCAPTRVLLLHGMGGAGKTMLAAEAVRLPGLIQKEFPHGVIWKTAGHIRQMNRETLGQEIDKMLLHLLRRLTQDWKEGPSIPSRDDIKTQLTDGLLGKRVLLVLDDVWQSEVMAALDGLPLVMLVTTRVRTIDNCMSARREYLETTKCSEGEAKAIVESHCGHLDKRVMKTVLVRCKGLPLALVITAAVLTGKSAQQQMDLLTKESPKQWLLRPFPPLPLEYHCFTQVLETSIIDLESVPGGQCMLGEYRPDGKSIMLDRYLDLAVLDDDETVFADKMAAVWETEKEEAENTLQRLADRALITEQGEKTDIYPRNKMRSLLLKPVTSADDISLPAHFDQVSAEHLSSDRCRMYTIHDVQLDFLRELVKAREDGTLEKRQQRWIRAFAKRCHILDASGGEQPLVSRPYVPHLFNLIRATDNGGEWEQSYDDLLAVIEHFSRWQLSSEQQRSRIEHRVVKMLLRGTDEWGWSALHESCRRGALAMVRAILDILPESITHTSDWKIAGGLRFDKRTSVLHVSCAFGHEHVVKYLIEKGAKMSEKDEHGRTFMLDVIETADRLHDRVDVHQQVSQYLRAHLFKRVKQRIASLDERNAALLWASRDGRLDMVQDMLDKGADIEAKDQYERTALHRASERGLLEVVQYLINKGVHVNIGGGIGTTALHLASREGHEQVVRYLVEKGAQIHTADRNGSTALTWASERGHKQVEKYLSDEMSATQEGKNAALLLASKQGDVQRVEELINNGADIQVTGYEGMTSLHLASQRGQLNVVQHLINKGAQMDATDNSGMTALHRASDQGRLEVIRYLIEKGATVNETDHWRRTALHWATMSTDRLQIVQHLAENSANIHVADNAGQTPLHLASFWGDLKMVQFLLDKGVQIDAVNGQGETALHRASKCGKLEIVQYLVGQGAQIEATDHEGKTPLRLATDRGKEHVVDYLLNQGAKRDGIDE